MHHHRHHGGFGGIIFGMVLGIALMWMAPEQTKGVVVAVGKIMVAAAEAAVAAGKN